MPKLLQDGVLIMPQNTQQYFYNENEYYQQSNVKNLVVKHLDQNISYGYSSPIAHYDYTQTLSNTEPLRNRRRRSSSKSRDNSLVRSSPHRTRQYNHREEYNNSQIRSKKNDMTFESSR